ncbi:hypothetical protein [Streptomyces sp. NPDC006997]|uniref:SCO2583 family membrane protein n=1 Tax=Streptomyces sp. NPDC006997 TaxID=3155356 RepID=UPI0033FCFAC5
MGGPGDQPEGTPDGVPPGTEDEYRSVVFDESFIRAARLQEFSARERTTEHAPAVRSRPQPHRRLSRQALILVLMIVIALSTALYMGVRNPYGDPGAARNPVEPLRSTVVPLAPRGAVPGTADVERLFTSSPAAQFRLGAGGIALPPSRRTANFSEGQVVNALTTAKDYIVRSSLYPEVLSGKQVRPVRILVDGDQLDQFDRSFQHPAADGRHVPTGWLVRFDPALAELADDEIRVRGSLRVSEADSATLEVTSDHTFVYALRPAGADAKAEASLFTVRRELHFRFDRDDLRLHQTQLVGSATQAGPLSCAADSADHLRPLLAGQKATGGAPAGTDPYATGGTTALCGTLADRAQPKV